MSIKAEPCIGGDKGWLSAGCRFVSVIYFLVNCWLEDSEPLDNVMHDRVYEIIEGWRGRCIALVGLCFVCRCRGRFDR